MWTYLLKRILWMIPTFFGITIITFFIIQLAPGNPIQARLGQAGGDIREQSISSEQIELLMETYHLDKPRLLNTDYLWDNRPEIEQHLRLLAAPIPSQWVDLLRQRASEAVDGRFADLLRAMREAPPLHRDEVLDEHQDQVLAFKTDLDGEFPLTVVRGDVPLDGQVPDDARVPILADIPERIRSLLLGLADAAPDDVEARTDLLQTFANRIRYDVAMERAKAEVRLDRLERWSVPALIDAMNGGDPTRGDIALRILPRIIRTPFPLVYDLRESDERLAEVVGIWRAWWERARGEVEENPDAEREMAPVLAIVGREGALASSDDWAPIDRIGMGGAPYLMRILLDEHAAPESRQSASMALVRLVRFPMPFKWEEGLTEEAKMFRREAWNLYWTNHASHFEMGVIDRVALLFTDTQYAYYMSNLMRFPPEFGVSFVSRRPVWEIMTKAIGISMWFVLAEIFVIYLVAIPVGIMSAVWRGSLTDKAVGIVLFMLFSLPVIFAAPVLQLVLGTAAVLGRAIVPVSGLRSEDASGWLATTVPIGYGVLAALLAGVGLLAARGKNPWLGLLGGSLAAVAAIFATFGSELSFERTGLTLLAIILSAGIVATATVFKRPGLGLLSAVAIIAATASTRTVFADTLWHAILPIACVSYGGFAGLSRYMRSGMLEVLNHDYIRTARAKGLPETKVIFKHALRNSLIPIVTLLAGLLPALVGGSVILETIFNIPGMGWVGIEAINQRDYPILMAEQVIVAVLVMLGILLADILYAVVDPRITYK